ncbi:hypothetical protein C1646_764997 [Rhizophagus diaphanus]|nr:hypothetical protein C1646_764997 [Rhizophagus diaphanus] [Rhizophagus sp. MUCL 43196]
MSSTEIMKMIEDNIIIDNIIDDDKTDNNIIDNNKTNVDNNDCIKMTLSLKEVQTMLREFGFDNKEWNYGVEPINIPLGVSMTPFVIREVFFLPSKNKDQAKILDPLNINPNDSNQHFLYRGIRTLDTIPVFLSRIMLVSSSVNNEFGPGLYCTPNFNLAVENAGKNGTILVYDWSIWTVILPLKL